MYNTALRIVKSTDDACDVMQDAFISAFEKLKQFSGKTPFEAWLRRIVINKSLDFLRKEKKMDFVNDIELIDIEDETNEEEIDFANVRLELVKEQLEKMNPKHQLILNLHLIEGLDYEEIAEMLNIPNGTVRVRYMRAKNLFLERINGKL